MKYIALIAVTIATLSGCATKNAVPVEYRSGIVSKQAINNSASIGVAQWKDSRVLASGTDEFADKAVMRFGAATVGMKIKGKDFPRVADFVRDTFIQELAAQGANVKGIDILPASNEASLLGKIAQSNNVEYVIGGDLVAFDISCSGAWTLDCSRKVAITLSTVGKDGRMLMTRETFDSMKNNNEGMGVLHSTLLDQMANDVMRQALEKAINRTIESLNQTPGK
jgi:hypothetical protein